MSGGAFDYNQYKITTIADEIEDLISKNGRKKTLGELKEERMDADWYKQYPEELYHYKYPPKVISEFKKALKVLRKSEIYANEIDLLISGDTCEESFLDRLNKKS